MDDHRSGDPRHPSARQLLPACADVPTDAIYADLELPAAPDHRPSVVLNMVSTVDGKVAVAGRARGLGSRLDRDLMRRIRRAADALLVGAATIRAETVDPRVPPELADARRSRGQRPQPLALTVSASLNLDPASRFFVLGPSSTIVFTGSTADEVRAARLAERARVHRLPEPEVDLTDVLHRLRREYGVARLLAEGGPTLNEALLQRDLVDEIFWTVSPKLAGGSGPGLFAGASPPNAVAATLELVSLFAYQGELFARYRLRRR